jgi:hypothetical protein
MRAGRGEFSIPPAPEYEVSVMRGFIIFLLLLVVVVVALGFQGWWTFSTSSDPETGKKSGSVTIDEKKLNEDVQKAKDKVKSKLGKTEQSDGK